MQAYYWYGHACNSRYLNTLSDIEISSITQDVFDKYQQPVITDKGNRIPAPDLRNKQQMALIQVLLCTNFRAMGFRNKDLRKKLGKEWKTAKVAYELRKLRVRGAVKKLQNSQYYQLTQEGYIGLYYTVFNYSHFINPLLSVSCKKAIKQSANNPSKIEQVYLQINDAVSIITSAFKMVA